VEASRNAEMVCVGSVGIVCYARAILGSTAAELAEKAWCPVAVIRTNQDQSPPEVNWIVVRMVDAPSNDAVVKYAAWEAKLRGALMLVLGGRPEALTEHADGEFERRVEDWRQRLSRGASLPQHDQVRDRELSDVSATSESSSR